MQDKDKRQGVALRPVSELSDEEKGDIRTLFFEQVVPKLKNLHARQGTMSCEFAGAVYKNWTIIFRSSGSDFEIVDFEYDEDAVGIDLDL